MLEGKGVWLWRVDQLLNVYSSLVTAVDALVQGGFSHVLPKVCNGWYAWTPDTPEGRRLPEFLSLCRQAGMVIVPWTYSYCHTIPGETAAIKKAWDAYGGDLFVIDAEVEYKKTGAGTYARTLVDKIDDFMDVPIGYSSYRFPSLHRDFPFGDFNDVCDFTMPQVYWEGSTNSAEQLQRCVDEYEIMTSIDLYAVGAAYRNRGWQPTPAQCDRFSDKAKELKISAINWWRWDTAVSLGLWDTLAAQDWGDEVPPPLTDKEKLDILWAMHMNGEHP